MATLRFLHTADWHLGTGFGSLPNDVALHRRNQQYDCIGWLVRRALEPQTAVEMFLIAGDVFDTPNPSATDTGFLEDQLRRLSEGNVQTYVIPGTGGHDAYRPGGLWERLNLHGAHLFRQEAFACETVAGFEDVTVWGIACGPARPDINLLAKAAELNTAARSIGLYHGGLAGRYEQEGERGNAFQVEDVERAPFNYLALGHYHRLTPVIERPKKKAYYPGSPTALGFRDSELGKRYAIEGTLLDDGGVTVSPVEVPSVFGAHCAAILDCTRLSLDEINERLRKWAGSDTYMTMSLRGIVTPDVMAEAREIEQRHRDNFGYLRLSLEFEDLTAADENEYLRLFREHTHKAIEEASDEEQKALLREALMLGTEALLRGGTR
jgi:DNA repair exonuclease SbcCD nuclease subunit